MKWIILISLAVAMLTAIAHYYGAKAAESVDEDSSIITDVLGTGVILFLWGGYGLYLLAMWVLGNMGH